MKRKNIMILLAILLFLASLSLILYPLIATRYNESHQSQIFNDYEKIVESQDNAEKERILELARSYNEALQPGVQDAFSQDLLLWASEDYADQLDITGTGVMGYVQIPKLSVNLPILHGTSTATLEKGVGHLLGSSLPVGGAETHTVLTGHSGMADKKMFSDLTDMQVGDIFFLSILGEKLAYQVEEINVVLPYETDLLEIAPGEDYCTLVTCTPFAVNTHRLLVRGTRIEYTAEKEEEIQTLLDTPIKSNWEQQYLKGLCIGILVVTIFGTVCWSVWLLRRKRHG